MKMAPQSGDDDRDSEEELLFQKLRSLKSLGAPPGLRTILRRSIRQAVERETPAIGWPAEPWWRRRIPIPLPAAAVGVALGIGFFALLWFRPGSDGGTSEVPSQETTSYDPPRGLEEPPGFRPRQFEVNYFESALYVRGIGAIERRSGYRFTPKEERP